MNKIRQYFSTLELTRGFFIALLSSSFIYLGHWGISIPILNTFSALLSLYLLLGSNTKTWFISGTLIGLFWFWWITLSFVHYEMLWAIPIGLLVIMLSYGLIFLIFSFVVNKISNLCVGVGIPRPTLLLKAIVLLLLSYVHPFGFDWYKPELMFVQSYIGIEKWQFLFVLLAIVFTLWRKQFLYLSLIIFAYQPYNTPHTEVPHTMALATTHTTVKDKWNTDLHPKQFDTLFQMIDKAIIEKKHLIVLPESVFPIFLNHSEELLSILSEKAKYISIVVGGLYHDGETPHNSTYIFTHGKIAIANKVLLVPFGESNPLPDFLSDWVNEVFYDGSVDYQASNTVVDYEINGTTYRNAICFEATSEKLYEKNKEGKYPKNMIVLSNNGWFDPSTEPTLQKLLLLYYHKKYGTTIYHSVNMSESYVLRN